MTSRAPVLATPVAHRPGRRRQRRRRVRAAERRGVAQGERRQERDQARRPARRRSCSAGCYWQLELTSDLYGPWELYLGIETTGGRQRFEQENAVFGNPHIGGLGDDATVMFGSTYSAVKGDTYVSLQYLAFGGDVAPSQRSGGARPSRG